MIQVSKEKIYFSTEKAGVDAKGSSEEGPAPLAFPLASAYVCPHCDLLVEAIYRTEKRLKDVSVRHFGLKDKAGLGPSHFTTSKPNHQVTPAYYSFLLQGGGETVEVIREAYHFNFITTDHPGRCIYKQSFRNPDSYNLTWYLYKLAAVLGDPNWFGFTTYNWGRIELLLEGGQKNAESLFDSIKDHIAIVEDVTGNNPPMWMTAKGSWGYSAFMGYVNQILKQLEEQK